MIALNKKNKILLFCLGFIISAIGVYHFNSSNITLSPLSQANISQIYPKAVLIKSNDDNNVWMINNNKKRIIANPDVFNKLGFNWNNIQLVENHEIQEVPSVKLVRDNNSPDIFYLTDTGYKYHIQNSNVFNLSNFSWDEIESISQEELNSYTETNLILSPKDSKIYKTENEFKRWITSPEVFEKIFNWKMVINTKDINLDSYLSGVNIEAAIWIDSTIVQPLEKLEVHFILSSSTTFNLKVENDQGIVEYEQEVTSTEKKGSVTIKAGGKLGHKSISLEDNTGLISPQVSFEVQADNVVSSGIFNLDNFYPWIKRWMLQDISYYDGAKGYRSPDTDLIWIRDHIHQSKGFCYFEEDMKSALDWFFKTQYLSGAFLDFCPGAKIEVEVDVEYLMVLGTYKAWQATGDDEWLFSRLNQLEKGLRYLMTQEKRWDPIHQLVKRPFTIDTWDFQWNDGSNQINENTSFGIMSGDNSGFYEASLLLSKMFDYQGNQNKSAFWQKTAEDVKKQSNKYLWNNGTGYYKNFLHLEPVSPAVDIDENFILSLSNVYNLNRSDFVSHDNAVRIIQKYQDLSQTALWNKQPIFQEWFSIYPDYGENKWGTPSADESGKYVNGGIMPLVGGELSRAAFEHGYENYGLQELLEYIALTREHGNKTYLWYWPDGTPGISGHETLATDGWGSSAFLNAFVEGLVGIKDQSKLYTEVRISPRWEISDTQEAKATIKYGASDGYVSYNWKIDRENKQIEINYTGSGNKASFHVLLPPKAIATMATNNGERINLVNNKIEQSNYADFDLDINYVSKIVINYR